MARRVPDVHAEFQTLAAGSEAAGVAVTVRGRVVHVRNLGKRLHFFDIVDDALDPAAIADSSARIELVVKYPRMSLEAIAAASHAVGLGGVVEARGGVARSAHAVEIQVEHVAVAEVWDWQARGSFQPRPVSVSVSSSAAPCKFMLNGGWCPRVQCGYSHAPVAPGTRERWIGDRMHAR